MIEKPKITKGWTSTMDQSGSGFSVRGRVFILKRILGEGKMKEYEDVKKEVVKIEVFLDDGRKFLFFEEKTRILDVPTERLKMIEVRSSDDELLETVTIDFNKRELINPVYIFLDRGDSLGEGSGNVTYYIAQKLLGVELDPRYIAGTVVDKTVIDQLSKIGKHVNVSETDFKLPDTFKNKW